MSATNAKPAGVGCNCMKTLFVIIALLFSIACSNKTSREVTMIKSTKEESLFRNCVFSNKDFAYEIDSCNCGNIYSTDDTVFIDMYQPDGGEVQGRLLTINYPDCDSSFYILMKHQNRYCTSSMGPDPILTDWILYNSPLDTIHFDKKKKGFYIDTIAEIEQRRFPDFDTLDFYKAYKKAVGINLNLDYVPDIAKGALYRQYMNYRQNAREVLADSYVELHRIILTLTQSSLTKKVIVFNYGHPG